MTPWTSHLAAPEELIAALVDSLPAAISVTDRDGRYLLVNDAWAAFHRLDAEHVLGRTDDDVFGAAGPPLPSLTQEALTGVQVDRLQAFDVDGEERIYASRAYPLLDHSGEVVAVCSRSLDVTREEREETLRLGSNRVLELIAGNAPLTEVLTTIALLIEG